MRGDGERRNDPTDGIENDLVRQIILEAIGEHACLGDAQLAGVHVVPARDRAVELSMGFVYPTVTRLIRLPSLSRVEYEDLLQSGYVGLLEAIDDYDPRREYKGRPVKPSTHFYFRIRKLVYKQVHADHWTVMRPTEELAMAFMQGQLEAEERDRYVERFMRPSDVEDAPVQCEKARLPTCDRQGIR